MSFKRHGFTALAIIGLGVLLFFFQNCSNADITQQKNTISSNPDNPIIPPPQNDDIDTNNGSDRKPAVAPPNMDGFALFPALNDPVNPIDPAYMSLSRNGPEDFSASATEQQQFTFSSYFFLDTDARGANKRMTLVSAAHSSWIFNPGFDVFAYSEGSVDITGSGEIIVTLQDGDLTYPQGVKSIGNTIEARSTQLVVLDSEWHNIHVLVDSTQATPENRIRVFIDGNPVAMTYTNNNLVPLNSISAFTNDVANICIGAKCTLDETYFDRPEFDAAVAGGLIAEAQEESGPNSNYLYSRDISVDNTFHGGLAQSVLSVGQRLPWTEFYDQVNNGAMVFSASDPDVIPVSDASFALTLDSTDNVDDGIDAFSLDSLFSNSRVSYETATDPQMP